VPKRNSPKDIEDLSDLTNLQEIIVDKRNNKRSGDKKNRRNRHYEKLFIKMSITQKAKNKKED
jgi:hypothetical protein